MYKNTRLFISERQRHSRFDVRIVNVIRRPLHTPQTCLANANAASKLDVLESGSKNNTIVSGWIAHKYNPETQVSEFVQHWWNFDPILKVDFDTTPMHTDVEANGFEYVLDDEVGHFASTQVHRLEHSVGRDIAFGQNKWWTIDLGSDGQTLTKPLPSLSIENLMYLKAL